MFCGGYIWRVVNCLSQVSNCILYNFLYSPSFSISSSVISNNSTSGSGGGVYLELAQNIYIENTEITGNISNHGGGIHNDRTPLTINKTLIADNVSPTWPAVYIYSSDVVISNSTLANNTDSNDNHAGIVLSHYASLEISNSILVNNGEYEIETSGIDKKELQ